MRDAILNRARQGKTKMERLNLLREELHHVLLQEFDRKGAFRDLCFVGGTALRIIHKIDRFSEDLDFSVSLPTNRAFDLTRLSKTVHTALTAFEINCEVKRLKQEGVVQSCFFSFAALLHTIDRLFHPEQSLAIKVEIDTNPPQGAVEQLSPIVGERLYKVRHYDLPSLFAGKLHALLFRKYNKGRDLYDFLWYIGKNISVNKTLLQHSILQTQGSLRFGNEEELKQLLRERFNTLDFDHAKQDVAPFLQDSRALVLFERQIFLDAVTRLSLC